MIGRGLEERKDVQAACMVVWVGRVAGGGGLGSSGGEVAGGDQWLEEM